MIRFLQRDNRFTKALFVVIIGGASISMCIYLIPGLTGMGTPTGDNYAVVYPHWYNRVFSSGITITQTKVAQMAHQQVMQRNPQYADNAMIMQIFERQAGQQLVQQEILLSEAEKLGIHSTDDDVIKYLQTGPTGQVLYPDGKFIGTEQYAALISNRLNISVAEFESEIKRDIAIKRLQALITAGVTVGDQEVRENYRKANIKIKFDYAVLSVDDIRKQINPSDGDLESFFKKNAIRYASAVPEERKITYVAFTSNELPGGARQPTQQEIQQYFTAHQSEYSVPEQSRSRHILIKLDAGADAKADAAAKAKAEGLLKQIQGGANFADLAKKNSDDPGSKEKGGELGFAQKGTMVPEFDNAIFSQKIGDTRIVKSQFGYHIVQVEERQAAHAQDISEVLPTIQATLIRQKSAEAEENYAHTLTSEAMKSGLEKTAQAHKLQVVTTPLMNRQTIIGTLPDSRQMVSKAFDAKQTDPPQFASTGEGYAVFQVTGIAPAHAPNFADWKSHVADDFRNEETPKLLSQKTAELAAKAKSLNDLAKAAKEMGAAVKTSDLVGQSGQVPDFGQVGQVAPQLFDMTPGSISGAINAQRTGVVVKLTDKQEPTPDEIAKNFDQQRDQILEQRRSEAFNVFLSSIMDDYKKHNRIRMNAKATAAEVPGE